MAAAPTALVATDAPNPEPMGEVLLLDANRENGAPAAIARRELFHTIHLGARSFHCVGVRDGYREYAPLN